jgi:hypothetical protein
MSDESIRLPQGVEPAQRAPSILFDHYCEHPGCKEWGSFGFARGRGEPKWFCRGHKGDGEAYL